jgi:AcrR family transcriptional regulator
MDQEAGMPISERRQRLKESLILAAERAVEARGLEGLKARDLAAEAGCALGAIYNVFADLDALILAVNARTLARLEGELASAAAAAPSGDPAPADRAIAQLSNLALAYLDFAAANTACWLAVFEHRMGDGGNVPEWYVTEQRRLFGYVEEPLRALQPDLAGEPLASLARSVFSAVHGVVRLGLGAKLGALGVEDLRAQTVAIVSALGAGLAQQAEGRRLGDAKP